MGFCHVRWETFQLIAMRRKKAEEYRIKQLQNEIKAKTDRSEAIKQGYSTLTQMSGLVRVVMSRAAAEIRQEVQQSQDISSDLVIDKAMEVSNQVIYPKYDITDNILRYIIIYRLKISLVV